MTLPTPPANPASEVKLTPAQRRALKDLHEDTQFGFRCANLGNPTGEALGRKGLVRWRPASHFGGQYALTEVGSLVAAHLLSPAKEEES